MATTRLRRTFQYPSDKSSDEEDIPKEMDEEEQEKLIAKFQHEEEERNDRYKRLFLIVPLVSATAFLPSLLTSRLVQVKIIDLLAITSLVCTAHILISMPNSKPQDAHLSYLGRPLNPDAGPLERCIDYLNSGLSLLVLLNAFSYRGKQGVHEGFWLICTLPVVVLVMVISARKIILEVDVSELQHLRAVMSWVEDSTESEKLRAF